MSSDIKKTVPKIIIEVKWGKRVEEHEEQESDIANAFRKTLVEKVNVKEEEVRIFFGVSEMKLL
jgi:hypothetical protein